MSRRMKSEECQVWLDALKPGEGWIGVWKQKFHCPQCRGIIEQLPCPICGFTQSSETTIVTEDGQTLVVANTYAGAIDWSTYVILNLMQREWERPLLLEDTIIVQGKQIPQRVMVVVLFWSLFENLMEILFRDGLRHLPSEILKDLLKRYNSIGSRLDRLYRLAFSTTFKQDLADIGLQHIFDHIQLVQHKRNEFIHGNPEAIDDSLVNETVRYLQDSQYAWISIYNKQCTGR